ncbi:MAG: T9SS type A sorting domain-containing protein, partial [Bacteroidota bacterium]
DHIETIDSLYTLIPIIQSVYDDNFQDIHPIPVCQNDCIWPGDTNTDGIVDVLDILRLSNKVGVLDASRFPVTMEWFPYDNPDWLSNLSHPDGVSYAHADCDGNGIIHAEIDFEAIEQNYGQLNASYDGDSGQDLPGDALYIENVTVVPAEDVVGLSTLNRFQIWVNLPPEEAGQVTGVAFELEVDAGDAEINSFWLPAIEPAFDVVGQFKESPTVLAYGGASSEGFALPVFEDRLLLQFRTTLVDFPSDCEVRFRLRNVQAIRVDGSILTLGNQDHSWPVYNCVISNTEDPVTSDIIVDVLPNPASDQVVIQTEGLTIEAIELFDVMGRQVAVPLTWEAYPTLMINHLPKGIYIIRLQTEQGEVTKRLIVQR